MMIPRVSRESLSGTTAENVTALTPGNARNRSSVCRKYERERAASYARPDVSACATTRLAVSKQTSLVATTGSGDTYERARPVDTGIIEID